MIFYLNRKINVVMFGRVSYKAGYWHKGRSLRNNLLLYLNEGALDIRIKDTVYSAKAGDVVLVPENTFYMPLKSSGCSYYFFHFEAEAAPEYAACSKAVNAIDKSCEGFSYFFNGDLDYAVKIPYLCTPLNTVTLHSVLKRAEALDLLNNGCEKIRLDLYFRQFIAELECDKASKASINPTIKRILGFISQNIGNNISLSDIANRFNLSKSYIARLFKRELNITAGEYILKQKMDTACALLINTDMSILEISEHLGFSSQYYFSNVFAKDIGSAPTVFRRNYKN